MNLGDGFPRRLWCVKTCLLWLLGDRQKGLKGPGMGNIKKNIPATKKNKERRGGTTDKVISMSDRQIPTVDKQKHLQQTKNRRNVKRGVQKFQG